MMIFNFNKKKNRSPKILFVELSLKLVGERKFLYSVPCFEEWNPLLLPLKCQCL